MSAERVDGVIASVERHDAALARWMRVAADGLTAGEGEELITQAGLQRYLWYDLPRRSLEDAWRPVAEAAGVLLALLGLDRYAAIARSATTTAVLEAWGDAPGKGFAQFRTASAASGVQPPDTDLLTWGEAFGMAEAAAMGAVEVALERAIVEGTFQPGRGPWRRVAGEVCEQVLLATALHAPGGTYLQAVHDERTDTWVRTGSPSALRGWRETARTRDVPHVEPSEIAGGLACEDDYHAMLSELVAHRLLERPAHDDALERDIGPVIAAQGWRAGREPVTAEQAGRDVHRALYHWRLFSLLDEKRPRWEGGHPTGPRVTGLNPAGRSAAIAFLRARATAPAGRSSAGLL